MLGQRIDLNVKSKPSGISAKNLKLTSSDENIIKVYDDGTVEGVALGTATVTATAGNGKFSNADIEVTEFHFTDIKDTISFKDEAYLAPVLQITGTKSEYKKSADSYILSIAFQCYLSRSTDADATLKWDLCDKDGFVFESKETKIESSEHISGEKFEKKVTVSNLPAGEYYLDVR